MFVGSFSVLVRLDCLGVPVELVYSVPTCSANIWRWKNDTTSWEKGFNKVLLWVQMRGLPLHCITHLMARKVGSVIGKVKETGIFQEPNGNDLFLKALVEVDTNFMVLDGTSIKNSPEESFWVDFIMKDCVNFVSIVDELNSVQMNVKKLKG
ncbi:ribonuclease H [Senna tora]|uniref:Ribonuclease H n=1 Tax=Senna tora TaxID=362788 RepID=A0A834W5L1_9FABA|nr:ribonuclease H [Senna tora]